MPSLDWIGKSAIVGHHKDVPLRLLKCDSDLSHQAPASEFSAETGNLVIEGDNLHALRSLLPFYKGKIKCIAIDPPYNTGNEGWIYNDNVNSPQIREWLGKVVDQEDLTRHDKWLCMMYARLHFHHQLLRSDGAIFICIDDNEVHNLRAICDEIFGHSNFVATIIWQKNFAPKNSARHFSESHDYILVYAKDATEWTLNLLERTDTQGARYKNPDNDPRGPWASGDCSARNPYSLGIYPITTPSGRVVSGPPKGSYWRFSEQVFKELDADNRIWWGADGSGTPRFKRFLSDVKSGVTPQTVWLHSEVGNTQEAKKELLAALPNADDVFITPKPTRLMQRILEIATDPGDIVLDSFAGSGTTAHAILKLNAESPNAPPRRFVLVEIEPRVARPITRERLKSASDGYSGNPPLNGSFYYCHLGVPLVDEQGSLNSEASWRDLAHFIFLNRFGYALDSTQLDAKSGFVGRVGNLSVFLLSGPSGIGVLDLRALKALETHYGPKIVHCSAVRVPAQLLRRASIVEVKQAPYEVGY